jgi:endo-1,4-beta-xylanase
MWKWSWVWALPLMCLVAAFGCSGDHRGADSSNEIGSASGALTSPIENDFEDGTLQGWTPRGGGVVLTNSTEAAFAGARSLKTTGRSAGFHGPSLNVFSRLTRGATYRMTASVRLVAGEAPTTARVTMQRTLPGGTNQFDTVASSSLTDGAWFTLSGTYTFTTEVTDLLLYVETTSATASYYVDSFSIAELAPAPLQHDFEDGSLQGWTPRGGSVVLTNTAEAAFGGTRSLKTTGRTAGFNGPSFNLLGQLTKGATYQVQVSVRLLTGEAPTTVTVTMQRTPSGGTNQFDTIASNASATDSAWVTLNGVYSFTSDVTGLLLYVEATSATAAYYIDGFSITQLAPPPGAPGNTEGAMADFETNTPEGWTSRTGTEVVSVTSADKHGGNFSLLTTGRTAAFRGPSFDVTNAMFNGSRYRVSVWAKLAPGEAPSQLRVSLERRLGTALQTFHTVVPNTPVTADGWVQLAATVDVTLANTSLALYVESSGSLASFYIDDFRVTFIPPPVAERDLRSLSQSLSQHFRVGAAVWQGDLTGEHAFLLTKHFNSITSENDMKWSALQPTEGNFTYGAADAQVAFAKANAMALRGHTLIWHAQTPGWVFNDASGSPMTPTPENRALLLQRLEAHIRAVLAHFGTDVGTWDVVNEVIDPSQPDGFRRSPWFQIIGPEYIEAAFRIAREVAPGAKLVINDFDTTNPTKRGFLFELIRDLKARGVPVDGIGHQMHNNIEFPSGQAIIDTIELFDGLGIENEVTELDVSIYSGSFPGAIGDYSEIPFDRFVLQGYRYRTFFQAFRQLAGKIKSVTLWGQADDHTWLTSPGRVDAPLLFDTSLKAKLGYWAAVDPLQLPGADLVTTIGAEPTTAPAGSAVRYTITVTNQGDAATEVLSPTADDLPAANVSLTSSIPTGTRFESLSVPAGWTCTTPDPSGTGRVQCNSPSLDVDASAVFTLTVVAGDCSTHDATPIVVSATATSTTRDPNPAENNTASASAQMDNPPPVVTLNGEARISVECRGSFTDPGATALDACDGSVAVDRSGIVNLEQVGVYPLSYGATDSAGNSALQVVREVAVSDSIAPAIDLHDLVILLPGLRIVVNGQTLVINGQAFTLTGRTLRVLGQTITFSGSAITINGQSFSVDGQTSVLLAPNHQYQTFSTAALLAVVTDSCQTSVGIADAVITQASSDEPENAPGGRDGNTQNDIVMAPDCKSVRLRLERDDGGNGRVYAVALRARDASGNSVSKTARVIVPRNPGAGSAIDNGPAYTVTSSCQ